MFIGAPGAPEVAADCEQSAHHLERRTRERVLAVVSEHGPVTAAEIGRVVGLTPAAVRRHLDALAEQSVIAEHDPTSPVRGRGRPARAWVVSEAGHRALDDDYQDLAAQTLRYLSAHAGPEAVDAFARERVAGLESRYAGRLAAAGPSPRARVDALVDALTLDGYAASARPVGEAGSPLHGIQLCQGHCPVGQVAEEFPAFCDAETDAISRLLGVHVQRLATLAGGAHVCTTFIPTPTATPDAPLSSTPLASSTPSPPQTPAPTPVPAASAGTPKQLHLLHEEAALVGVSPVPPRPHHERSSR